MGSVAFQINTAMQRKEIRKGSHTHLAFKMDYVKWKTLPRSESEALFGNHGCHILDSKEERNHPACYQCTVHL